MSRLPHLLRAVVLLLLLAAPAGAQLVTEAPQEPRIRALAQQLRCPVCQSESILESRSSTAAEMLVLVREMVAEGRSDPEILRFFRDRYGDFVMLAPPSTGAGRLIWALPLLLLAGGGGFLALRLRRRRGAEAAAGPGAGRQPGGLDAARLQETEL